MPTKSAIRALGEATAGLAVEPVPLIDVLDVYEEGVPVIRYDMEGVTESQVAVTT